MSAGPPSWPHVALLAAGMLLAGLLPATAQAQAFELQLREVGSHAPVAGAIVRLLGEKGPVAQGLTNEQGRIVLRALAPGIYRIKADRIGYSGLLTGPIEVAAGDSYRREIDMPSTRLELPTLEVRGKSACDRAGQGGTRAAALWEEVNKALTANLLTQRERPVPLHVRSFQRELNRDRTVLAEWVYASHLNTGNPFRSNPAAWLAKVGFVEVEKDTVTWHVPDASLLLSDEFVATHCFRPAPARGNLVGLVFEPVPGRKVTDVRGTMWVDSASSELRFLEYAYSGLEGDLARAGLGGRVEFRRLPAGTWIVGDWHVRMPRLREDTLRGMDRTTYIVPRVVGYVDQGGRVEIASAGAIPVARAILRGRVHDSTTGRGLAGASVRVLGYPDSVFTDTDGRFELVVAAVGEQTVIASHPKLGLLRDLAAVRTILSLGDTTVLGFSVPSLATFVRALCGATERGRSGIVGVARHPEGRAAENLEVRVSYATSLRTLREERARVGPRGVYALCGLPPDRTLTIQLLQGKLSVFHQSVPLGWGQFSWVELGPAAPAGPTLRTP